MASKDHGLTPIELSSFCSEIALMLGAGMPLYAGMEALEKTYEDDAHAALYRGVSETLTQTGSLRDALESAHAFPNFPMIYAVFAVKSWEFCFFPCPRKASVL